MSNKSVWAEACIGKEYWELDIANFEGDAYVKVEVEEYIQRLHQMYDEGLGILAYGGNGGGKTFLMVEILKAASRLTNPYSRRPYSIWMTSLSEIVSTFTSGWTCLEDRQKLTSKIINSNFLLIDDAEKVYMPKSENNVVLAATDMVLRKRTSNKRPTLITSNEAPPELVNIFGKSIGSLLAGWLIPIKFDGEDFRKKNRALFKWKELKNVST